MSLTEIRYRTGTATCGDIANHLLACDTDFLPHLHTYVDIRQYSKKLSRNAVTFEAWNGNHLIGLVAIYLNDPSRVFGFISSVSVLERYSGLGIASRLIRASLELAREKEFRDVSLEVETSNTSAIQLYEGIGFASTETALHGRFVMRKALL